MRRLFNRKQRITLDFYLETFVAFVEMFLKKTSMLTTKFHFPNPEKQFLKMEWLYALHATLRKAQINERN